MNGWMDGWMIDTVDRFLWQWEDRTGIKPTTQWLSDSKAALTNLWRNIDRTMASVQSQSADVTATAESNVNLWRIHLFYFECVHTETMPCPRVKCAFFSLVNFLGQSSYFPSWLWLKANLTSTKCHENDGWWKLLQEKNILAETFFFSRWSADIFY